MGSLKMLLRRGLCGILVLLLLLPAAAAAAETAQTATDSQAGTYVAGASLSCYVNAMGGIDFGKGLCSGLSITIDENGNATATLGLTASTVTIYSVTCNTFVDPRSSKPGYYSGGSVVTAKYTTSSATALDPNGTAVHFVDSMTFPVTRGVSTYTLFLYVNSSVMGVQFGNGSGSGASNTPGANTPYKAVLTIDWDSLSRGARTSQRARVVYSAQWGYEISIPTVITVNPERIGLYDVTLSAITATGKDAYITVTTPENGRLSNGTDTLEFTSTLEDKILTATGDALAGRIEVTEEPENVGIYTGTVDFVIRYYATGAAAAQAAAAETEPAETETTAGN